MFVVNLFSVSLVLRALLARHSTRLLVGRGSNGSGTIKTDLHKYREFSATAVDLVSDQQICLMNREKGEIDDKPFQEKLRVAIIGQSQFAAEVYKQVRSGGHEVVGVFTVPDVGGREDPVAETAKKDGVKARDTRVERLEIDFYARELV